MPVKPKKAAEVAVSDATYTCLSCGNTYKKQDGYFFKTTWSQLWNYNNKYFPVCKSCMDKMFQEYSARYSSDKIALMIACHYLDVPFYNSLYDSIVINNSNFSIGMYSRQILNNKQYQYKTFVNTLVDGELSKTNDEVKEEREEKWNKADKQNMNFAISIVGYDPFDNCGMTDSDRKYCFNILAGYCDTDGIQEDGHKIQSVVQITQGQLQCRKLDELINEELLKSNPEDGRIKQLTTTKKSLLDSIAKIAQDNNLSSNYNSTSKQGVNTLSSKMKEMLQSGFDQAEVNLFDIKTAEAMKQIADLSNRSIMEQLTFDANDYTEMIKEQREMIIKYEEDYSKLAEENRLIKNQLLELQSKKR